MLNNDGIPHFVPVSNLAGQAKRQVSWQRRDLDVRAGAASWTHRYAGSGPGSWRTSNFRSRFQQTSERARAAESPPGPFVLRPGPGPKKKSSRGKILTSNVCVCVRVTTRAASQNFCECQRRRSSLRRTHNVERKPPSYFKPVAAS